MSGWRDIKRQARAVIHDTFKIPAVYLTHAAGTPVACNVRVHSKVATGQSEFTWPSSPGYLEIDPYILFDKEEVAAPLGKAFVIVSEDEVYRIGVAEPSREQFIKASVTLLDEQERETFITSIDTDVGVWSGILT